MAANPKPGKQPVAWWAALASMVRLLLMRRVNPKEYVNFDVNPDVEFAKTVQELLLDAGFQVSLCEDFEQIHDTLCVSFCIAHG